MSKPSDPQRTSASDTSRRTVLRAMAIFTGTTVLGCNGSDDKGDTATDGTTTPSTSTTPTTNTTPTTTTTTTTTVPPAEWQLDPGHFIPAKMAMTVVMPRPASEIGPDSTYVWAHEDVRYEVPIGVTGGAWPFLYELVDAPAGMTIGGRLVQSGDTLVRPDDYGVIQWVPPAGSDGDTFEYTVRVTDQELNTVEVTVSVTVSNAKFVFVAPGSGGGTGTLADPLLGFSTMYGAISGGDATYAGRLAYFRGGAYTLIGGSDTNGNVNLGGAYKPKVWRGFPDETPTFDCTTANIIFNFGQMDDLCFGGLQFDNGRQDVSNAHYIWATTPFNRGLFWRNRFTAMGQGQVGNDNPAAIFFSAADRHREYLGVISNTFDSLGGPEASVAGYDSYGNDYALYENNQAWNHGAGNAFFLKGGHRFTTVRGEYSPEADKRGAKLNIALGRDGNTQASDSVEVTYCAVGASEPGDSMRVMWNTSAELNQNIWFYRCTVHGGVGALHQDEVPTLYESCVFTDDTPPDRVLVTYVDHVLLDPSELDGDLALVGTARTDNLGIRGFEVA